MDMTNDLLDWRGFAVLRAVIHLALRCGPTGCLFAYRTASLTESGAGH